MANKTTGGSGGGGGGADTGGLGALLNDGFTEVKRRNPEGYLETSAAQPYKRKTPRLHGTKPTDGKDEATRDEPESQAAGGAMGGGGGVGEGGVGEGGVGEGDDMMSHDSGREDTNEGREYSVLHQDEPDRSALTVMKHCKPMAITPSSAAEAQKLDTCGNAVLKAYQQGRELGVGTTLKTTNGTEFANNVLTGQHIMTVEDDQHRVHHFITQDTSALMYPIINMAAYAEHKCYCGTTRRLFDPPSSKQQWLPEPVVLGAYSKTHFICPYNWQGCTHDEKHVSVFVVERDALPTTLAEPIDVSNKLKDNRFTERVIPNQIQDPMSSAGNIYVWKTKLTVNKKNDKWTIYATDALEKHPENNPFHSNPRQQAMSSVIAVCSEAEGHKKDLSLVVLTVTICSSDAYGMVVETGSTFVPSDTNPTALMEWAAFHVLNDPKMSVEISECMTPHPSIAENYQTIDTLPNATDGCLTFLRLNANLATKDIWAIVTCQVQLNAKYTGKDGVPWTIQWGTRTTKTKAAAVHKKYQHELSTVNLVDYCLRPKHALGNGFLMPFKAVARGVDGIIEKLANAHDDEKGYLINYAAQAIGFDRKADQHTYDDARLPMTVVCSNMCQQLLSDRQLSLIKNVRGNAAIRGQRLQQGLRNDTEASMDELHAVARNRMLVVISLQSKRLLSNNRLEAMDNPSQYSFSKLYREIEESYILNRGGVTVNHVDTATFGFVLHDNLAREGKNEETMDLEEISLTCYAGFQDSNNDTGLPVHAGVGIICDMTLWLFNHHEHTTHKAATDPLSFFKSMVNCLGIQELPVEAKAAFAATLASVVHFVANNLAKYAINAFIYNEQYAVGRRELANLFLEKFKESLTDDAEKEKVRNINFEGNEISNPFFVDTDTMCIALQRYCGTIMAYKDALEMHHMKNKRAKQYRTKFYRDNETETPEKLKKWLADNGFELAYGMPITHAPRAVGPPATPPADPDAADSGAAAGSSALPADPGAAAGSSTLPADPCAAPTSSADA